jgi:hypothetical protein
MLIRRGEAFDVVHQRDVESNLDVSKENFQHFFDLIPDVERAEQFIERHSPEHFRASILNDARRRIGKMTLIEHLALEASRNRVSFEEHAERFWSEIMNELGVETP